MRNRRSSCKARWSVHAWQISIDRTATYGTKLIYHARKKKQHNWIHRRAREAKARSRVFQLYNQQEKICIKTRYDITSRCFWYAVNVELITRDFARSSTSRRFKQKSDSPDITMRIPARYDGPTDILYINSSYEYTCVLICITSTGDTWKASARVKKKTITSRQRHRRCW